jgi:hypothetical protein
MIAGVGIGEEPGEHRRHHYRKSSIKAVAAFDMNMFPLLRYCFHIISVTLNTQAQDPAQKTRKQ